MAAPNETDMKTTSIFALALAALAGTVSPALYSQTSMTADTTAIQPAAVTGGFADITPEMAPRAMVVVSAEEATMSAATSVAELLETVPGIDVQSRGAFGIQTDLSVRGGTFEQTALWVDGVRLSLIHI